MGRPRPAVRGLHWHRLDSVASPGPGQRKYLCAGVPKGGYSVRLLGAKTEIPDYKSIPRNGGRSMSHMTPQMLPVVAIVLLVTSWCEPARADVFVLGSTFTVQAFNSPDNFKETV